AMCSISGIAKLAGTFAGKADIKTPPRRSHDIAADPVSALAATVRQVIAAHRLGLFTETARQIGGAGHIYPALRSRSGRSSLPKPHWGFVCPCGAPVVTPRSAISVSGQRSVRLSKI